MMRVEHHVPSPVALQTTRPFSADTRSLRKGLLCLAAHLALYVATLAGAVAALPFYANVLFGIGNGVFIALLFIIGHDAAHGSLVPGRMLNRWIARFAFVPCVHAPSLWREIHNKRHHGYTNLKGVDGVWAPMSTTEYASAPRWRQWLERLYRGPAGPLVYYYLEFWIHRSLLPLAPEMRPAWKDHVPDSLFAVSAWLLTLFVIGWTGTTLNPDRPLWLVLTVAWVLPFAIWNYLMAFSIYLNHTHPSIPWFRDERTWKRYRGALADTASVLLPANVAPVYTQALHHTVHHKRPSVPLYDLIEAEAELKRHDEGVLVYRLGLSQYRSIYRACKLFDFDQMCWTDFDGNPTAWPLGNVRRA